MINRGLWLSLTLSELKWVINNIGTLPEASELEDKKSFRSWRGLKVTWGGNLSWNSYLSPKKCVMLNIMSPSSEKCVFFFLLQLNISASLCRMMDEQPHTIRLFSYLLLKDFTRPNYRHIVRSDLVWRAASVQCCIPCTAENVCLNAAREADP